MPSGGARNRSGPQADPNSLRSAIKGVSLSALPSEGYAGEVPEYPLPRIPVFEVVFDDEGRHKKLDDDAPQDRYQRELELWAWAWRTPQAAAWAKEPWRWQTVAMWVRTMAVCESSDATAADKNSLHRFADQIGLTPAGLKENGWKIAVDQVSAKRAEKSDTQVAAPTRKLARDRFKVVGGDA